MFEGIYVNGHRVKGTITYDNGSSYTGEFYTGEYEWHYGEPHGNGTLISANGEILFKGEYNEGQRWNGYGKEDYETYSYEGEYKNGSWNGKGTEIWKDAKNGDAYKYVGSFVNRERTNGRLYFVGGDMYEGTFKNGTWENGEGTYYDADDHTYETGTWKNGILINQTDEGTWHEE